MVLAVLVAAGFAQPLINQQAIEQTQGRIRPVGRLTESGEVPRSNGLAVLTQPSASMKPQIKWNHPATSPYSTTTTETVIRLSFQCVDDVTCTEARFVNDAIFVNDQSMNAGKCSVPSAEIQTKTITCSVRIAPYGIANNIALTVRDAAGNTATIDNMRQVIRIMDLEFAGFKLPDAVTNVAYGAGGWPLRCIGGKPPYAWSVVGGSLPTGFSLSSSGVLNGTHTGKGTFNFTARCRDAQEKMDTAEQAFELVVGAAYAEGPHDYFNALVARKDHTHSNSLRTPELIAAVRTNDRIMSPPNITYQYVTDLDLRRQEAAKIVTPEGKAGPGQQLHIPAGPSAGANVLITFDFWFGSEFHARHSQIQDWKGTPAHINVGQLGLWSGGRVNFLYPHRNTHTLPPGGPFVAVTYAQAVGKMKIIKPPNWWCCDQPGYPPTYLPTHVPTRQGRSYNEAIAPVDNSAVSGGQELGMVGDRWTRIWHYFERVPTEDWVSAYPGLSGTKMAAYKWSLWMADTKREPMRFTNEGIIGIPSDDSSQIIELLIQFAPGNSAEGSMYVGRGQLTAYYRNVVVLHGTSKGDVLPLLRKPVQ